MDSDLITVRVMILQTIIYGFVLWFGLYLFTRSAERKLQYTGIGLGAYALALAFDLLAALSPSPELSELFLRIHWSFLILPSVFWTGAAVQLFSTGDNPQNNLDKVWRGILVIAILFSGLYLGSDMLWNSSRQMPNPIGYLIFAGMGFLPLIVGGSVIQTTLRQWKQTKKQRRRAIGLILTTSLFFALGSGIIFLQFNWLPHLWAILALSFDLELLGFAIVYLDAFEQRESLWPDFFRSLATTSLVVLLFGGQIAFAMAISTGVTFLMMVLLLTTISIAILTQIFSDPIQVGLDRLVFARRPHLRQERAELRAVTASLPKVAKRMDVLALSETEFIHHTRRALSHFGDLAKLASNPLTYLPVIEKRIRARAVPNNTLERAAELKILLAESIERLKPPTTESYGVSDEWRFYNALYYPYVVGIRPYSRRVTPSDQDQGTEAVLVWFRTTVPERTLHNWQNTAASLVARDLQEQNHL